MTTTSKNPYIGPRTFQKDEGHLFFGREREARDLISLVASERLVVFYAQSGAGKSSIVNTRLIPSLETKEYEVLPVGRVSGEVADNIEIDNIYIHNLLRGVEQHGSDPVVLSKLSLSAFLAHLKTDENGFFYDPSPVEVIQEGDDVEIVRRALVIDQFEELFSTHPEDWEKRDDFFQQLAQAMEDDPYLWVVLVMREDYIASLDPYAHHLYNGLRTRYYMQRLEREAALKAVTSPVKDLRPYADGVAEKLIDDLCSITVEKPDGDFDIQPGQYVEPVQLQVVCYGLWENLSADGSQITEKDLQDVGDVNQSLGKYYDRRVGEVAKMKKVQERLIREWFEKKLITVGGIRNMVLQERETKPGELADDVIHALQSDLVRAEKRGGATWYELTHDRLVEPILERNKTWFTEHLSPLQRQAALWKDQNRGETWLLQDHALIEVEVWAGTHKDELTDVEKDFLKACRAKQAEQKEKQNREAERRELESARKLMEEEARSARIGRRFNLVAGVLVILALFATISAIKQSSELKDANGKINAAKALADEEKRLADEQKDIARSSELSTIGLVLSDSQLDLAMLLGIKADSVDNNEKSQSTLATLSQKSSSYLGTIKGQEEILDIQFSPHGKIFASRDINGITLWDADTFKPLTDTPLNEHYAGVTALAANSDGTIIASGGTDGTIILWDARERKMLGKPFPAESDSGSVINMAFSPDGKTLVSAGSNTSTVILWDITDQASPKEIGKLEKHQSSVSSITFSPDGKMLATGSYDGTIILWNITIRESPEAYSTIVEYPYWVNKLAFLNGNGDVLVSSAGYDVRVILWNVKDPKTPQKIIELADDYNYVRGLAISQDNQTLASGNIAGVITLWNISDTSKQVKITTLNQNNEGAISSFLAFVDNDTLASTSYEGNMVLWSKNVNSWERVSNFVKGGTGVANAMIFLPHQNIAVTGSSDSTISFWDTSDSRRPVKTGVLIQESPTLPTGMQFSPDGSLLASYGDDATILFDTKSQSPIGPGSIAGTNPDDTLLAYETLDRATSERSIHIRDTKTFEDIVEPFPGQNPIFSPNGKWLVFQTTQRNVNSLHIWDIVNKKELTSPGIGNFLSFSPDGDILVYQTATQGINKIHLWDIAKRDFIVKDLEGFSPYISSDGKILLYQTITEGINKIHLWDIAKRDFIVKDLEGSSPYISKNGKTLLYQTPDASEPKIRIYLIASEEIQNNEISGSIAGASQDNKVLVFTTDNLERGTTSMNVLDTDTGNTTTQLVENGTFQGFSADRRILFYQSADGKTNLLDTAGQNGAVIPGGTYVASTQDGLNLIYRTFENNSNTIRLWDVASNKNIGVPVNESYGSYFAISPNGEILVTKNEKNDVVFWDMTRTWSLGQPVSEKAEGILGATLSQDGSTLGSIGKDGITLQGVDNVSMSSESFNDHFSDELPGGYNPRFSLDGKLLAIGDYTSNITTLWDVNTMTQVGKELSGYYPRFSSDGKLLAVGDITSNTTTLWDVNTMMQIGKELPGYNSSFSLDGKLLAIGDLISNTTTLWEVNTMNQLGKELPGNFPRFSSDGKLLAIGDFTLNTTTLWDVHTMMQIGKELPGYYPSFSRDTKLLAIGDPMLNTTTLWEVHTMTQIGKELPGDYQSFSLDGKLLAVGDLKSNTTTLWDVNTMTQIGKELPGYYPIYSSDGNLLAIGSQDDSTYTYTTTLWDMNTMAQIGKELPGYYPSFSSDTKLLAIGDFNSNSNAYITSLWDLNDKKLPVQHKDIGPPIPVTSLAFSLDNKQLATLASDGIAVRNLETNVVTQLTANEYTDRFTNTMSFYTDDTRFAAIGDDGNLITWDVETGTPTIPKESDPAFGKFTGFSMFSPNGNYLIYNESNSLRVWDVVNNEPYNDLTGIDIQAIENVKIAFNPEGDVMAFAEGEKVQLYYFPELTARGDEFQTDTAVYGLGLVMDDNTKIKYLFIRDAFENTQIWDWDLDTQTKVGDPIPGNLQFIGSSTQDHTVFYIDSSGRLIKYKWDLDHEALKNLLCERVQRNFTLSEWNQYISGEPYPVKQEDATCPQ